MFWNVSAELVSKCMWPPHTFCLQWAAAWHQPAAAAAAWWWCARVSQTPPLQHQPALQHSS